MNKLLVICGPTATGKTALGIRLAKKFNGEIASADSRHVYRGMDIGTGKDLPVNSKLQTPSSKQTPNLQIGSYLINGVKIWLYDVVEPDYKFTVADYVRCATRVIEDIWERGKLPILVGGTGFYIKALVDGVETIGVPPDWKLRRKLQNLKTSKLQEILRKLDPKRWKKMSESDRQNPRRLMRAIEIAKQYQKSKIKNQNDKLKIKNVLFIGLKAPNQILYERIDRRVERRIKQGVIEEIKKLLKKGYSWENSVLGETIGYKEFRPFFENKASLAEVTQRWKYDEHGYARRQTIWFKKDKKIAWFNITRQGFESEVEKKIESWF